MKKRKQKEGGWGLLSKKISNRLSYTIIAFVGLMLAGVFVFAIAPNPGHDYRDLDLGPITIEGDNVGIGTTRADSKLSVGGAGSTNYAIYGYGTYGVYGYGTNRGVYGYGQDAGVQAYGYNYDFYTSHDAGKSYFAGKVGIGVTGPAEKLEVDGRVKATGFCIGSDCRTSWPSGGGDTPTLAEVLAQGYDAEGRNIYNVGTLSIKDGGSINTYYGQIEIKDKNINMKSGGNILNAGTVQTNTLNANTVQANTLEDPEDGTLTVNDDLSLNGNIIKEGYIRTWDCQYTAQYCAGSVMKCPSNKYLAGIEIRSGGCLRGYCCRP